MSMAELFDLLTRKTEIEEYCYESKKIIINDLATPVYRVIFDKQEKNIFVGARNWIYKLDSSQRER